MKKKIWISIIFCCIVLLFAGCGKEEKETKIQDGIKIYYTNKSGTKLVYETIKKLKETDSQAAADILIENMRAEPREEHYFLAIPSEVVINNVVARSNIVHIDFAAGYETLEKGKDVLCRAAIVKTLIQIQGIDYVEFSIGGKTMMDAEGNPIGSLTEGSFVFDELPMKE